MTLLSQLAAIRNQKASLRREQRQRQKERQAKKQEKGEIWVVVEEPHLFEGQGPHFE